MAKGKVNGVFLAVNLAAILFSAFVEGGKVEEVVLESSGGLPFLQFTNGGVRVNFGGYHAEAGLGGLLGGSRAGGGLHASAGTPFGAHAGAGLGGLLGGDTGSTGGGLHAEAGLGHGRPEARAGLGGVLNANSNNPVAGGLYAHATPGDAIAENPVATGVQAQPTTTKIGGGHTNIQILSRGGGKKHMNERAVASKTFVVANEAVPPEPKIYAEPVAPVVPIVSAGLHGSLYAGATAGKSIEKSVVVETKPINEIPKVVESHVPSESKVTAEANAAAGVNVNTAQEEPVYNRWHFRKRFRTGPKIKHVIHTTSYVPNPPVAASASGAASAAATGEILTRVNADNTAAGEVSVVGTKAFHAGSLFDDIFNIPISTLTAVNQLLKNNVG
ncbi:hypothetical protein KPH14_006970 [Odynerus spinipes]|uniref:Uncharacterized protein n=1 Tax=Odynerus spinipes TaxID=1348599 RepID=A0AAD9RS56_9HYME|nr:hypothetical protein KPH14_006970 [Odynerus spinipes]